MSATFAGLTRAAWIKVLLVAVIGIGVLRVVLCHTQQDGIQTAWTWHRCSSEFAARLHRRAACSAR